MKTAAVALCVTVALLAVAGAQGPSGAPRVAPVAEAEGG